MPVPSSLIKTKEVGIPISQQQEIRCLCLPLQESGESLYMFALHIYHPPYIMICLISAYSEFASHFRPGPETTDATLLLINMYYLNP